MPSDTNLRDYAMGILRRFRDWGDGTYTEKVMVVLADGTPATFGSGGGSGAVADLVASGTLTAAQPTANASVAGGAITLPLGTGQGTWVGQIIASRAGGLGSTLVWEYSEDGGTTWNLTSVRSSVFASSLGNTTTLTGTAQTIAWRGSCPGWTHVRVRCSSFNAGDIIAGTLTATVATDIPTDIAQGGTDSTDANATQATAGVGIRGWLSTLVSLFRAGTAKVGIKGVYNATPPTLTDGQQGDVQLTKHGEQTVAGGWLELTGLSAGSLNADLVPGTTDIGAYRTWSLQILGTWTGTLTFQASNDGVNWVSTNGYLNFGSTTLQTATANNQIYSGTIQFRFLRVRMTAYTSGTATGVLELHALPSAREMVYASVLQNGNWSMAIAVGKIVGTTSNGLNLSPNVDTSFGTVTSHASKASGGQMFSFRVDSVNSALVYFQLFNKASAPVGGDTPIYSFPVPAGSATVPGVLQMLESFFGLGGKNFATGIAWGISSTAATFTDAGTASNYSVHVHYN